MKRWVIRILGGLLARALRRVAGDLRRQQPHHQQAVHTFQPAPDHRARPIRLRSREGSTSRGCRCFGCHADSLKGQVLFDEPMIARLVAPNVPAKLATADRRRVRRILAQRGEEGRHQPVRHAAAGLLPHQRRRPRGAHRLPPSACPDRRARCRRTPYRPMGRFGVMMGQFKTAVPTSTPPWQRVGDDPAWATTRQGRVPRPHDLHRVPWTTPHRRPPEGSPSLSGALGYSPEEFVTLLRTGTPRDTATKARPDGGRREGLAAPPHATRRSRRSTSTSRRCRRLG